MKHAVRLMLVALAVGWLVAAASYSVCGNSVPAYIGNVRSCVFHRQTCRYLPAAKNRTYFDTRAKAIDAGYRPCRKCKP
ncbi:MAG: Ada metal-binding domain-containing protein [Armatimonadetes bacterium]|nr:Ada metal-binding domain-containing protein [Armatimonadota bacterium]